MKEKEEEKEINLFILVGSNFTHEQNTIEAQLPHCPIEAVYQR